MIARMFSPRSHRPIIDLLPGVVIGMALLGGCTGAESDPRSEELAELQGERSDLLRRFSAVQDGIRRTQAAALDAPGVRAAQESFYEALATEIVAADPAAAGLLERAKRVGADLTRVSGPVITTPDQANDRVATPAERRRVADELAATEQELRPHIEKAMRDPEVSGAFLALQDSVAVTMTRLDPNSSAAIERLNQIAEQMREVDAEIARLESGR